MNSITAAINIIMTTITSIQTSHNLTFDHTHTFVLFYIVLLLAESRLHLAACRIASKADAWVHNDMVFKIAPS